MPDASEFAEIEALKARIGDLERVLENERSQQEVRARIFRLLSHEFRTPLTIILSSTELLQAYGEKWPQEKRAVHLGKIVHAVGLLSSQLDDVLLFNRMQANSVEAVRSTQPWAIRSAFEELTGESDIEVHASRIELACDAELEISLDRRLALQVLRNLLHNALRYTRGSVRLCAKVANGELAVSVEDEGEGFPEPEREHLFEPFFRGRAAQGQPGTGLGLAIVKECVRIMGGCIRYEPADPHGSRFVLEFKEYA